MLKIKRIYDPPARDDGFRVLVDRLWPRGVRKDEAKIDLWLKDISPSEGLRKWYHANPEQWEGFRKKYLGELAGKGDEVRLLRGKMKEGSVTLLYAKRDTRFNNAAVLKDYLESGMKGKKP
jgi:uncharacterized protein YeaO (DUF488 family)